MKKIIAAIIFVFTCSVFAQPGWVQQQSGTTSNLTYLQFLNANTGFACGNGGVLLSTTNGGLSWVSTQTNLGNLSEVQFLNKDTGIVSSGTTLYRTTNAGANWTNIFQGMGTQYFHFINFNTGYTQYEVCNKTTNGGINWQSLGYDFAIGGNTDFIYLNDTCMFAPGWDFYLSMSFYNPRISKSSNSGNNWAVNYTSPLNPVTQYVSGLSFPNVNSGYGVSIEFGGNYFLSSANSGANWIKTLLPVRMFGADFINNSTGWLAGIGGGILFTSNGGANFTPQSSGVGSNLLKIYMLDNLTGWIAGDGGIILKTTNGGVTSFVPVSSEIPEKFSLYQNYPNPFNPTTNIKFSVPQKAFVTITIYNVLGEEISKLVNEEFSPGTYETNWNAENYPSGVYYFKLVVGDNTNNESFTETKKMLLIK